MEQELWSVHNAATGTIFAVVAFNQKDALKAAAKLHLGRSSAGAVGKMVLEGCQPIQVKIVPLSEEVDRVPF
jgi:hypothetical protein